MSTELPRIRLLPNNFFFSSAANAQPLKYVIHFSASSNLAVCISREVTEQNGRQEAVFVHVELSCRLRPVCIAALHGTSCEYIIVPVLRVAVRIDGTGQVRRVRTLDTSVTVG